MSSHTIILKPIEAHISQNANYPSRIYPYCEVFIGKQRRLGQVCPKEGTDSFWEDSITFKNVTENTAIIEVKDWNMEAPELFGSAEINLEEIIQAGGSATNWYDLVLQNNVVGRILIEIAAGEEANQHEKHELRSNAVRRTGSLTLPNKRQRA